MSQFDRKKIAVTLAFASLFGGKTQAMNTIKNGAKSPQTLGAVSNNNSNLLANPRMLKKSKSMSNLTKGLTGVGIATGVVGFANEVMGAFTNAEAWYNGKFSIVNGIKYLLAPTLVQRKALFTQISDILNSFNEEITEESQRIVVSPGSEKQDCLTKAKDMLRVLRPDMLESVKEAKAEEAKTVEKDNKMNEKPNEGKTHEADFIAIAGGYVSKLDFGYLTVKYSADSVVLKMKGVDEGKCKKAKLVYTMNKDGSLTVESASNDSETGTWKATFMPASENQINTRKKQQQLSEENNKKKKDEKNKKKRGKYYDDNMKMIKQKGELNNKSINKLICLIDDRSNCFLNNIKWIKDDWDRKLKITPQLIKQAGVGNGKNSWVVKALDVLRGNSKLHAVGNMGNDGHFRIFTDEKSWVGFCFYDIDDGLVKITGSSAFTGTSSFTVQYRFKFNPLELLDNMDL